MFTKLINVLKEENEKIDSKLFLKKVKECGKAAKEEEGIGMVEVPKELVEQIEKMGRQIDEIMGWLLGLAGLMVEAPEEDGEHTLLN